MTSNNKTVALKEHWADWVSANLGTGYGTGEWHTIQALRTFLENCNKLDRGHAYEYESMEKALTPTVFWLLVEILYKADALSWGTSARYGWLTAKGEALKDFALSHTCDELYKFGMDEGFHCTPRYCSLHDNEDCCNPFFKDHKWDSMLEGLKRATGK